MPCPRLCAKCPICGEWKETDRGSFENSKSEGGWRCKPCATRTRNMSFARPEGSTRMKGKYIEQKVGKKWVFQHRVVAAKKIGRPVRRSEAVHHIDGNPLNNHPDNLDVMDNGEHTTMHHTGLKRTQETCRRIAENRTIAHIPNKLSAEKVLEIRARRLMGESCSKMAEEYNVDRGSIYAVVKRKIWRHI